MERVKQNLCKEFKRGTKGAHQYSWEAQSLQVEDGCYIGPCNEESGKKLVQQDTYLDVYEKCLLLNKIGKHMKRAYFLKKCEYL